jgi:hypothetical protein
MQSNIDIEIDNNCSICLSDLNNNYETMSCKHNFHKKCITEWLNTNSTCPICRGFIEIQAPIAKLSNKTIYLPTHNNHRRINYTKIKKIISIFLYILFILFHVSSSIYYCYQTFIINNNINKYIKPLNQTELDNHDHNTYLSEVLIIVDIIYYFFFIIINLIILKNVNIDGCCCSRSGLIIALIGLWIANFVIHGQFYSNTNSYLNDKNFNFNIEYTNNLSLAMILFGSSFGGELVIGAFTFMIWWVDNE